MDMCINDESIDGQFESYDEAVTGLTQLAELTMDRKCREMRNGRDILTVANIANKLLTKDQTVKAVIQKMVGDYDPAKQLINQQLLQLFVQKPFIKAFQADNVAVKHSDRSVKKTALDAATVPFVRLAVISVTSRSFSDEIINIQVDDKDTKIFNFTTIEAVAKYYWQYQANERKHLQSKKVKYGNEIASPMSLVGEQAQLALSNSLLVSDGLSYHLLDKQWFAFRAESAGIFHGYCIDAPSGDAKFNKANKLFTTLKGERIGQVFSDFVNW